MATGFQVGPLFVGATGFKLCQAFLQFNASHTALPEPLTNPPMRQLCTAGANQVKLPPYRATFVSALCLGRLWWLVFTLFLLLRLLLAASQSMSVTCFDSQNAVRGYPAFSARRIFSMSRSFIRALCSCDLLLPIEHPTMPAISLCS